MYVMHDEKNNYNKWLIKEEFFQETVCTKKSFQEDNEGFVNGTEKPNS